jgi:SAM-dependent methyltransferase
LSIKSRTRDLAVARVSNLVRSRYTQFYPHADGEAAYSRPIAAQALADPAGDLPVPPREFWADYCTTAETFLRSGQEDVSTMRRILAESDAPVEQAGRVLELGCAGARMLRWLADLAPETQLWGTDIWSSAIVWCQDNLTPPMYFATNTVAPTLPYEDRSFDLVFCGSLFTHIDDLAETWFLELHRIVRPGGRLYFSINDRHAVKVFDGQADPAAYERYYERTAGEEEWNSFVEFIGSHPDYQRFRRGDAYMVTMGRGVTSHVMWDTDVLCERLAYGWRKRSITPEAYGHQTAVLLERT